MLYHPPTARSFAVTEALLAQEYEKSEKQEGSASRYVIVTVGVFTLSVTAVLAYWQMELLEYMYFAISLLPVPMVFVILSESLKHTGNGTHRLLLAKLFLAGFFGLTLYLTGLWAVEWGVIEDPRRAFGGCVAAVGALSLGVYALCPVADPWDRFLMAASLFPIAPARTACAPCRHRALAALWMLRFGTLLVTYGVLAGFASVVSLRYYSRSQGEAAPSGINAFIGAALAEELYKVTFTGSMALFAPSFAQDRRALWLLSAAVAVGFTTTENLLYFVITNSVENLFSRAFLILPMHTIWNLIAGAGIVRQRSWSWAWGLELVGFFALAVGLHGMYDFVIFCECLRSNLFVFVFGASLVIGPAVFVFLPLESKAGCFEDLPTAQAGQCADHPTEQSEAEEREP